MFDKIKEFEIRSAPLVDKLGYAIKESEKRIVGQKHLMRSLFIGLISGGHILLEGFPGLAKTLSIRTISDIVNISFKRIQFMPDMLPADLLGTTVYRPQDGTFITKQGPLFSNLILADEINRAPAKVQSALLEVMQERQITIGEKTYPLEKPFLVLATQNPIEQEGTYNLPEAQLDRFMMKISVDYPSFDEEKMILDRYISNLEPVPVDQTLDIQDIAMMSQMVSEIFIDNKIKDYIVKLVYSSRTPAKFGLDNLVNYIEMGASPRATLMLALGAKTLAFMNGKGFVSPQEVKEIFPSIMGHRLKLTFEAEAENIDVDEILNQILRTVTVP